LFGPLIASFFVIEQLVGGVNSLIEKYFVRSVRWRPVIRLFKVAYLLGMFAFVPWLASKSLLPSDQLSLIWLAIVACAGLLPLSEMYAALERHGQVFVAIGSGAISFFFAIALGVAWFFGSLIQAALVSYVALPGTTFLFYWMTVLYAHNDPQR
jgi:hypothetical protein